MNERKENYVNGPFYSWWAKLLVILLSLVMAVMACFGLYLIAGNLESLTANEAWKQTEYANSQQAYSRVVENVLPRIEAKIDQSEFLEDGVFDGDKTLDIMNPSSDKKKKDNTSYKLKDLVAFYQSANWQKLTDRLETVEDDGMLDYAEGNPVYLLEQTYEIESYFRDKNGNLYGVAGEINGLSNTRDVIPYEYGEEETSADEEEADGVNQIEGSSSYLYIINQDGSARPFVFGRDKDVDLIFTSRADMMARLMDTSELKKGEDISKFYGVYGERFCQLYSSCRKLESVKPLSGRTIASYALLHPYDFSIMDAYEALLKYAEKTANAYEAAEKVIHCDSLKGSTAGTAGAHKNKSDVDYLYFYRDLDRQVVYSNVDDWKGKEGEQIFFELEDKQSETSFPHFYFKNYATEDAADYSIDSVDYTLDLAEGASTDAWNYVDSTIMGEWEYTDHAFELIASVNPQSPLQPFRMEAWSNRIFGSDEFTGSFKTGVALTGIGGILFLLFFIMSMVQVANPGGCERYLENGRRNYRASAFARSCPLILMLGIFAAGWAVWGIGLAFFIDFVEMQELWSQVLPAVFAFILLAAAMFIWNVLTLLAKIKTRSLWKNSILLAFCRMIRRICRSIYQNRKATGRLLLVYGMVTVLALIGLAICMDGDPEPGVCILFLDWAVFGFYLLKKSIQRQALKDSVAEIAAGNLEHQIRVDKLSGDELEMAQNLNNLRGGMQNAINEQMKSERMKTDLITNVSHDIKTPLTSIINYVDLLKREEIQDEKIAGYIDVLDSKSARLKQLTEDLVEASKISSGNIVLECVNLDLGQLIQQVNGEFLEKFEQRKLELVCNLPDAPMIVYADGRRISRVFENLYNNAAKYAMPGTRVYVSGQIKGSQVVLSIKNISEQPLNVSAEELMERFVRGDVSRSTEGSGLGLEIARNLTLIQNGQFDLYVDGDLFRATTTWNRAAE